MNEFELVRGFLASESLKFTIYLICINFFAFLCFGIDKYKAIRRKWRISESFLLSLSVLGGAFGGLIGMILFRHKIRKPMFLVVVPLSAAFYIAVIIYTATAPYIA